MRESNYTFPPQNRAVVSITHLLYDRRALDTNSALALLNNLTSLTYLTSTSPRIREILTLDGGLERLLDVLRDSCLPREGTTTPDLWGLNGPPTARVINVDRQISLRHSLAFQCVVNIGVRGSEAIRTRVVQAGALDLVAQILESWLKQRGVAIFAGPLGSQVAVDAVAAGLPVPGTTETRRRSSRTGNTRHAQAASSSTIRAPPSISQFVSSLTGGWSAARANVSDIRDTRQTDTDVDMADAEETDGASVSAADDSMDVDDNEQEAPAGPSGTSTTPRASHALLPLAINIRPRAPSRETVSQASSAGNSMPGDDMTALPRTASDNSLVTSSATVQAPRPIPLMLGGARIPSLAQDPLSNQSSPMGTPSRNENVDGMRAGGRRGTIVGRPVNVNLTVRNERRREQAAGSGTSDGGEDVDLPTATIAAGIAAANAQAMEGGGTVVPDEPGPPPNVEIVETEAGAMPDDPDPEMMAAEQARLDMAAGAPPGQPGAAQTPRATAEVAAPIDALLAQPPVNPQAQIIIANGAPRGFQDLGSYVGISSLLNPDGDRYSDDSILLALQLLAYLSKYPHVRAAFHHPRRPMHPTFDWGEDYAANPLPERPAYSQTPNIFSLVERFTFRPSPSDPMLFRIPAEIQYWAGVIMRNACRKDEAQGGIRQCANMSCGRWESFPREFAKCRRCRKAKYCSKDCQSRAWSEGHRFWCNVRNETDPSAATGPGGGSGLPPGSGPPGAADDDDQDMDFPHVDLPHDVIVRARAARAAQNGNNRQAPAVFPSGSHLSHSATSPILNAIPSLAPSLRPWLRGSTSHGRASLYQVSARQNATSNTVMLLNDSSIHLESEDLEHTPPHRPQPPAFRSRAGSGRDTVVNGRGIEWGDGTVFASSSRTSSRSSIEATTPEDPLASYDIHVHSPSSPLSPSRGRLPSRSTRITPSPGSAIRSSTPAEIRPYSVKRDNTSKSTARASRSARLEATGPYGEGRNIGNSEVEPLSWGIEGS